MTTKTKLTKILYILLFNGSTTIGHFDTTMFYLEGAAIEREESGSARELCSRDSCNKGRLNGAAAVTFADNVAAAVSSLEDPTRTWSPHCPCPKPPPLTPGSRDCPAAPVARAPSQSRAAGSYWRSPSALHRGAHCQTWTVGLMYRAQ